MKKQWCLVLILASTAISWGVPHLEESKEHLPIIHLGKGTRLVVKRPVDIAANVGRLLYRFPEPNKYQDFCLLNIEPSQEDRRLSEGREIVLSGRVLEGLPPHQSTYMTLEVESPSVIKSVQCRNSWDGRITIEQMRNAFAEDFELVFPEPKELSDE